MSKKVYDVFEQAKKLVQLSPDTDSKDWAIARVLLYEQNLPGLWAKICLLAAAITAVPVLNIWFLIECVNGLRRQTGKWEVSLACGLLNEIKRKIDFLPREMSATISRLTELWCYHGGWVYHSAGQFDKAEACHRQAAELAQVNGDERAKALAEYNQYYEGLHYRIGNSEPELKGYFRQYNDIAEHMLSLLTSVADEDFRWRANILCHVSFFTWIVTGEITTRFALSAIDDLPESTKPAFLEAQATLLALFLLKDEPAKAVEIAQDVNPEGQIDWRSYAMYIRGLALVQIGRDKEAQKVFQQLRSLPEREHGGHLIQALIEQSSG